MTSGVATAAVLTVAGIFAGVVGTAGGITSLVSYPALLVVGVPPLPASIVNTVSVVACWPGSAIASRRELAGRRAWLTRWACVALAGGGAGAALLLTTPPGTFARVVPFLLGVGSLVLLLQGRIARSIEPGVNGPLQRFALVAGLFLLSLYNGYFGAGAGVLTLLLTLLLVDRRFPIANALKNMFVGAACIVAALAFTLAGRVRWSDGLPLAAGLFLGSLVGPRVARRLPANLLRWLVALMGLAFAVRLAIAPL